MTSECTHQCITGTIHEGLPQGTEETIHGLNTYVIGNRSAKKIIVIYSDIFGLGLPNNKIIADAYAKSGEYLVYLPDFFKGDAVQLHVADLLIPVDPNAQCVLTKYTGILTSAPGFIMWMTRHKDAPTNKICMDFLEALRRETVHDTKIGMVGMCWGGRYAIRAASREFMIENDGEKIPLVDAVIALHPSNMVYPTDVGTPVVPLTIGWGLEDIAVNIEQKGKVEDICAKAKEAGEKLPVVEHQVYTPGRHGFSVRGNPDDPQERKCLEDSMTQVLDWCKKWL